MKLICKIILLLILTLFLGKVSAQNEVKKDTVKSAEKESLIKARGNDNTKKIIIDKSVQFDNSYSNLNKNGIRQLKPGQILKVVYNNGEGFKTYTVKKGDTIERIAKKLNVSISSLYAQNKIQGNSVNIRSNNNNTDSKIRPQIVSVSSQELSPIAKLEKEINSLVAEYRGTNYSYIISPSSSKKNYDDLSHEERKTVADAATKYYSKRKPTDKTIFKGKFVRVSAIEDYYNKFVKNAPPRKPLKDEDKKRIEEDLLKKLDTLFDLRESEKLKEIQNLEKQIHELQNTISERKKNKQQIIEQRLKELIGTPTNLKW